MDQDNLQRYYCRRRCELQDIDKSENILKNKTISILDKDARESIVVSLQDSVPKEKEKDLQSKEEFLEKHEKG